MEYYQFNLSVPTGTNATIWQTFGQFRDAPGIRRSHLFEGRYENIYIPRSRIPAVEPVLDAACEVVARILACRPAELGVGFWFNEMSPGDVTLLHSHDDDDEMLSGVYYVRTPPGCGDLELGSGEQCRLIRPVEGRLVLFRPDLPHAVGRNLSDEVRLSIGMNFGRRSDVSASTV